MTTLVGRGVRVEVQKTLGAAKTVSAITQANPGVASSTSHAQADGTVGYLSGITGMVNLEGQAVRVDAPAADSFALQGIDTTGYPAFTGTCSFFPVTAWSTLSRAASYSIPDGTADQLDDTVLLDNIRQLINGLLNAQTVSIGVKGQTVDEEALTLITAAALSQGYLLFRITFSDGAQRVFRGQPSIPGEDVQQGSIATGSIAITVKGTILRLPAVA